MATSIKQIYPIPTSFRPRRQFRGVETSNVYKTINITLEKRVNNQAEINTLLPLTEHINCIVNAKSRADVGDRLRDCTTENIHTRNTLVIGFKLAILR